MSGSLNRASLIGHLGRDPETRTTQAGKTVVSFGLATSESWKDRDTGERRERTEWHRVVIFNEALAGIAERYCRKGARVMVEGAIQTRKFTDSSGAERTVTEIVLQQYGGQLLLLGAPGGRDAPEDGGRDAGGRDAGGRDAGAGPDRSRSRDARRTAAPDLDDEIPF